MSSDSVAAPAEPVALLNQALADEERGAFEEALTAFRGLAAHQPDNPRWPFEGVRVLLKLGRNDEAAEAFLMASRRWPRAMADEHLRALVPGADLAEDSVRLALAANCPSDGELKRPLVQDDGSAEVLVARGGRDVAVLVFTGLADRLVMPVPVFDRYLAELDLTAVYLRDRRRLAYLGGVPGLGADYAATIAALRAELDGLGAKTVHTLGNSVGGVGALAYGLDLDARQILLFAAPLDLTDDAERWDDRAPVFTERLRQFSPAERDLRARIVQAGGKAAVRIYFGAEAMEDRRHAYALEGAPNVSLHPLEGLAGHGALFELAAKGELRPLLKAIF